MVRCATCVRCVRGCLAGRLGCYYCLFGNKDSQIMGFIQRTDGITIVTDDGEDLKGALVADAAVRVCDGATRVKSHA